MDPGQTRHKRGQLRSFRLLEPPPPPLGTGMPPNVSPLGDGPHPKGRLPSGRAVPVVLASRVSPRIREEGAGHWRYNSHRLGVASPGSQRDGWEPAAGMDASAFAVIGDVEREGVHGAPSARSCAPARGSLNRFPSCRRLGVSHPYLLPLLLGPPQPRSLPLSHQGQGVTPAGKSASFLHT